MRSRLKMKEWELGFEVRISPKIFHENCSMDSGESNWAFE